MELYLNRVAKQYGNKIACDRISLKMERGVYGLLGANGAGKTTLMRMICGVITPTSGEITFNGINVQREEYRDVLGYLPQNFGYYPEFRVQDFMMYLASLKGIPKTLARERTSELLELVSLENEEKNKIKTLSGGMKQRLGIAQALLNDPKILVLDEPTAGLDPKERVKFRNIISRLGQDRIVLLSTHIVSDVEYIAEEILMMKEGQILHKGSREEIIQNIRGKIWECRVKETDAERLCSKHTVINLRNEKQETILRVISDTLPGENSIAVEPTLEDLYLYYFQEEARS